MTTHTAAPLATSRGRVLCSYAHHLSVQFQHQALHRGALLLLILAGHNVPRTAQVSIGGDHPIQAQWDDGGSARVTERRPRCFPGYEAASAPLLPTGTASQSSCKRDTKGARFKTGAVPEVFSQVTPTLGTQRKQRSAGTAQGHGSVPPNLF